MTDIRQILDPACTRAGVRANSRKAILQTVADLIAEQHDLPARALFDELMNRERLGSTGLGDGVAIPHCRMECDGIHAACLTLANPVDYDAVDGQPVDLIFALVVPPEEQSAHLDILATLARLYGSAENRERLREARSDEDLYERLTGMLTNEAA